MAWRREAGQAQRALPAIRLAEAQASSSSSCKSKWPKGLSGPLLASLPTPPTPFMLCSAGPCTGGSLTAALSPSKNDPSPLELPWSYDNVLYDTAEGLRRVSPWLQHTVDAGDHSNWSEFRQDPRGRPCPGRFQGPLWDGAGAVGGEVTWAWPTAEDPGPRSASSVAILCPCVSPPAVLNSGGGISGQSRSIYQSQSRKSSYHNPIFMCSRCRPVISMSTLQ